MLAKIPDDRISIQDILDHPWLTEAPEARRETVFNHAERKQMIREFFYDEDEDHWRACGWGHGKERIAFSGEEREELHGYSTNNLYSTLSDPNGIGPNQSTKSVVLAPKNSTEEYENDEEPVDVHDFERIIKQKLPLYKFHEGSGDIIKFYVRD